jgi:hypothetical protein
MVFERPLRCEGAEDLQVDHRLTGWQATSKIKIRRAEEPCDRQSICSHDGAHNVTSPPKLPQLIHRDIVDSVETPASCAQVLVLSAFNPRAIKPIHPDHGNTKPNWSVTPSQHGEIKRRPRARTGPPLNIQAA